MNGKTTFISRGAEIGVSRGMIIVVSAGNEGNKVWKYINAPADVSTVFTVGAVNITKVIAPFSSYGPTSDNNIKPDVLAQGESATIIDEVFDIPKTGNGTSYSSPIMAGVVACFWQAFPNLTNLQIMQKIRESADRYNNPSLQSQYGYGVPDFQKAYTVLAVDQVDFLKDLAVFPNPLTNSFTLQIDGQKLENTQIQIFNVIGKKVFEKSNLISKTIDVSELNSGIYILKITNGNQQKTIKLIKK